MAPADARPRSQNVRAGAEPRRLPVGVGLGLGLCVSLGLWALVLVIARAVVF